MALIDLGELRDEPEPYPPSRRPRIGRPWRAALVLALVLATVAGAAPTVRRISVVIPVRSGAEVFLVDDLLLVVEVTSPATGGGRVVVAYDLPERRPVSTFPSPLWRMTVPGQGGLWPLATRAGIVLLSSHHFGVGDPETLAVDAATGRTRWRQPGSPVLTAAGGVLLETSDEQRNGTVRVVDLPTGRARWQVPTWREDVAYGSTDGERVDRFIRILPSGRVELRDPDTGRVLLEAPLRAPGAGPGERIQLVDDLLVVVRENPPEVTAYELTGLTRRWRVTAPAAAHLSACGPVLCAAGPSGGVWGLDRATGRTLWSGPQWMTAYPAGDRLVATTSVQRVRDGLSLLDARTGRVLADLGHWNGMRFTLDGRPSVVFRGLPDGRLLVAELDARTGRTRVLDVLPDTSGDCRLDSERLLCHHPEGGYRLWWLRH